MNAIYQMCEIETCSPTIPMHLALTKGKSLRIQKTWNQTSDCLLFLKEENYFDRQVLSTMLRCLILIIRLNQGRDSNDFEFTKDSRSPLTL